MSLPVFHRPDLTAARAGTTVEVDGGEARHAVVVRRIRRGERVRLTDGEGTSVVGTVEAAEKARLAVAVEDAERVPEPRPRLVVVQALAKGDRGELAVELLTEAGADVVVPWAAARSVAVWRGDRAAKSLAKWRSTAREAAKQSRRAWFPTVAEPVDATGVAELLRASALPLVLHEEAQHPLPASSVPGDGDITVVVGPEGGITEEELRAFTAAGATAVVLGPTVLRTSTAGVVAAAALLSRTARWQ